MVLGRDGEPPEVPFVAADGLAERLARDGKHAVGLPLPRPHPADLTRGPAAVQSRRSLQAFRYSTRPGFRIPLGSSACLRVAISASSGAERLIPR